MPRPGLAALAFVGAVAIVVHGLPPALGEETVTKLDADGKLLARWQTDDDGLRHGTSSTFHPSGRMRTRAKWRHGELHGEMQERWPNGKLRVKTKYVDGLLDGPFVTFDEKASPLTVATMVAGRLHGPVSLILPDEGEVIQRWENGLLVGRAGVDLYTHSLTSVHDTVQTLMRKPTEEEVAEELQRERVSALNRLRLYRMVCGLPWEDIVLDDGYNALATAAAAICEKIGKLDHTPKDPGGMSKEAYEFAYKGTSRSNLAMGGAMDWSVDMYMDDSDASNIDRVGHRRWCLSPTMLKTGFGVSGKFSAMYAFDGGREPLPKGEGVAYPARGYMPVKMFSDHHVWSFSPNPRHFQKPDPKTVKVRVYELDARGVKAGEPLELDHFDVRADSYGNAPLVKWRVKAVELRPGKRHWVEIDGLSPKGAKKGAKHSTRVNYLVHWIDPEQKPRRQARLLPFPDTEEDALMRMPYPDEYFHELVPPVSACIPK